MLWHPASCCRNTIWTTPFLLAFVLTPRLTLDTNFGAIDEDFRALLSELTPLARGYSLAGIVAFITPGGDRALLVRLMDYTSLTHGVGLLMLFTWLGASSTRVSKSGDVVVL